MHNRFYKYISMMIILCFSLVTCSGCFGSEPAINEMKTKAMKVSTLPANITYRKMDEDLFLGYLGAYRDFILVVDNMGYNSRNDIGACRTEQENGCASILTQLVINYGIKAGMINNIPSDKNVLINYVSSDEFINWGLLSDESKWLQYLVPSVIKSKNADFNRDESILKNLCQSSGRNSLPCKYANEMTTKGFSTRAGQSMILFYERGDLSSIVTDNELDPLKELDNSGVSDNVVHEDGARMYESYYVKIVNALKDRVSVSNATIDTSASVDKRSLQQLETVEELKKLVNGEGNYEGIDDFILMVNSEGFINEKIGINYSYKTVESAKRAILEGTKELIGEDEYNLKGGALEEKVENLMSIVNTQTEYNDNCAVESSAFVGFLKGALKLLLDAVAGGKAGGEMGYAIGKSPFGRVVGFLSGGILGFVLAPVAGAIFGGIIGFFAGLATSNALDQIFADSNGITGDKYCKIMTTALKDFPINVPIYTYTIASGYEHENVKGNVYKYVKGDLETEDKLLNDYYKAHERTCLTQKLKVDVPTGLGSLFFDAGSITDDTYVYADACEKELVENYVGTIEGSPSLLLFNNHKRVDDIHGRATSTFIREVMYTWGLTTIGYLYNINYNRTIAKMDVSIGAAQKLTEASYCLSNKTTPGCDPGTNIAIDDPNFATGSYVNASDPSKGIRIDFTDYYNELSMKYVNNYFNQEEDNFVLKGPYGESDTITVSKKAHEDNEWAMTNFDAQEIFAIQKNINDAFKQSDNWVMYKKAATIDGKPKILNYLISGSKVIAFEENPIVEKGHPDKYLVKYFNDTSTNIEYVFEEKVIEKSYINENYITIDTRGNNDDVEVLPAISGFFIYLPYTAENGETGIYTYAL